MEPFDPVHLGNTIRAFRVLLGLTQQDVAARSGASITTIYGIESGRPARVSSLRRVCAGMGTDLDEFLKINPTRNVKEAGYVLHRASTVQWHAPLDRRKMVPGDNDELVQDPAERRRLGRLGLTPLFGYRPHLMMPQGPGTTFIELYGRYDRAMNADVYREALICCQRGSVRIGIGDSVAELGEGDVVGFSNGEMRWMEPIANDPDELPTRLLWIGAVRIGRVIPLDRKRVLVRRPKV